MMLPRRRKPRAHWPLVTAAVLAATAAYVAWNYLLRSEGESPSEDERREVEAFEEYERRKRSGAV